MPSALRAKRAAARPHCDDFAHWGIGGLNRDFLVPPEAVTYETILDAPYRRPRCHATSDRGATRCPGDSTQPHGSRSGPATSPVAPR